MSHPQQQAFIAHVKAAFPHFFSKKAVLEIGSLDVNGSVRNEFTECDYTGIDLAEGPGVDIVSSGESYDAYDASYDVVVSCEVMEHNPYWHETFKNMIRMLRPGGLLIMTCASVGRPEHGTTATNPGDSPFTLNWSYYHNLTAKDFRQIIKIGEFFSPAMFFEDLSFNDLYFVGFKRGARIPGNSRTSLVHLWWHYCIRNLTNWRGCRRRILIGLFGEKRYLAGPLRFWPSNGPPAE